MATIGFNTRSIGEEQTACEAVDFAVEHGIGGVEPLKRVFRPTRGIRS